jgi:hypothetical protein
MDFNDLDRRSYVLIGLSVALAGFLAFGALDTTGESGDINSSEWREVELEEVDSGESFTISGLEKPLLVETFAVWCPTCTNQQNEIKKLKEDSNITSVSLDVDSNEDQEQVSWHKEENGFDWRYAISPSELTRMLIDRYGNSIANPPSAPVVLVCENGSRRLENGVKQASILQEEIEEGC